MLSLLNNPIVIQIIGFIAFGLSFFAFQFNHRKSILNTQLLSSLLFAAHFFLLGAYTGAVMNLIGATRNYTFNRFRYESWSIWVLWGFIMILSLATILTWQGWISLLPAIGTISGAFAAWQSNTSHIRLLSLISPPAWLVYAYLTHSYAGIVTEIFLLSSILLSMYRFDRKRDAQTT